MRFSLAVSLFCALLLGSVLAGAQEKSSPVAGGKKALGTVTGKIDCGESCRGVASLWNASGSPPDPRRYIVIPVSFTPLQPDGSFRLSAPPGRYYIGAIVRSTPESTVGPPRPGDRVYMSPDANGNSKTIEIREGELLDLGLQGGGWVYEGFGRTQGAAIEGRVQTRAGKGVPHVLVFAFDNVELSGTPVAVSERTRADGSFLLRLPRPGTVYLRVMENYGGGRPTEGGYIGVYGDGEPLPLVVEGSKTVRGVTVEALRLPPMRNPEQNRMKPSGR